MHDVNFKLWNGKEHALRFVGDFGGQWNLDWTQTKFCIINLLWRNFRLKSCVRSNPRSITQIAPKTSFLSCYYCTRCVVLFYSDSNDRRQICRSCCYSIFRWERSKEEMSSPLSRLYAWSQLGDERGSHDFHFRSLTFDSPRWLRSCKEGLLMSVLDGWRAT